MRKLLQRDYGITSLPNIPALKQAAEVSDRAAGHRARARGLPPDLMSDITTERRGYGGRRVASRYRKPKRPTPRPPVFPTYVPPRPGAVKPTPRPAYPTPSRPPPRKVSGPPTPSPARLRQIRARNRRVEQRRERVVSSAPRASRPRRMSRSPRRSRIARVSSRSNDGPSRRSARTGRRACRTTRSFVQREIARRRATRPQGMEIVKAELEGRGHLVRISSKIAEQAVKGIRQSGALGTSTGAGPAVPTITKKGWAWTGVRDRDSEQARGAAQLGQVPRAVRQGPHQLPRAGVPSVYVPAKAVREAAEGDPTALKAYAKDIDEHDPLYNAAAGIVESSGGDKKAAKKRWDTALREAGKHPGFTALELYGAKGVIGRGAGRGLRTAAERLKRQDARRGSSPSSARAAGEKDRCHRGPRTPRAGHRDHRTPSLQPRRHHQGPSGRGREDAAQARAEPATEGRHG